MRARGLLLVAFLIPALPISAGCDLTKLTLNGTMADAITRAGPAAEQHWDYDLAGDAIPYNLVQLEGFLRIVPENETFLLQAIRGYTSYTYGWIEDEAEQAKDDGDLERSIYLTRRAKFMYLRARDLGKHWISLEHEGLEDSMEGGLPDFEAWLDREFDDPDEVGKLLWTGYSWGSYINTAKDDMAAVADLPFAQALVEKAVELDPTYFDGAGAIFLAVLSTEKLGADLDAAQALWERAIELTERKNLLVLVNMARTYAVKRQDRELYVSLLREVLEAGDINPEQRLATRIAKRRAARYLRRVDRIFGPAE